MAVVYSDKQRERKNHAFLLNNSHCSMKHRSLPIACLIGKKPKRLWLN